MFNKKNFIILVIIINMIISVCTSMNVSAAVNLAIYTSAAPTTDAFGNIWVYFGTGDKTDPSSITSGQERVYAIKDSDRNLSTPPTYSISNLTNITSGTYDPASSAHGWYIILPGTGEKMLAAPTVYDQKVYFTTYTPNTTPCSQNGDARLYVVDYLTGAGLLNGVRSEIVGQGIPSGAVISVNPYGNDYNVYITTGADQSGGTGSGGGSGTSGGTGMAPDNSIRHTKLKYFIYWKDNRIQ